MQWYQGLDQSSRDAFALAPSLGAAYVWMKHSQLMEDTCADPEGGTGGPDPRPPENHKNIGFLSNTGPDTQKNHKATKPALNVPPAKHHLWRFAGGPIMASFKCYLDPLPLIKKRLSELDPL